MKYSYLLVFLVSLFFLQCNSDSKDNDPDGNCLELQEELNAATSQMLTALDAYTKDSSDAVCKEYREALENRIEKAQALLDSGCIEPGFVYSNSEAAIAEDQDKIDGLNC